MVLGAVVNSWDDPSSDGEVTGGEASESGSECEGVDEEELLMAQILRLQLQNEAGDAGGRVVKQVHRQ